MEHVLHDSGKREEFATGAKRDTREGKGRFDLISPIALRRLALVYERGAAKYDDHNWTKGIPMSRCLDSALRHLNQYKEGKRDEDHLAQAAWNIFAMLHFEELRPDLNDLPVYVDNNTWVCSQNFILSIVPDTATPVLDTDDF